jgi:ATP-dependent metalloprotease FtsH
MWNSRQNRLILIISAFIVLLLFAYATLRDTAKLTTLEHVEQLLASSNVEKVIATERFIYLVTSEGKYKIANSQVTPKMFADQKVDIEGGNKIMLYLLMIVVILGIGSIGVRWWLKRHEEGGNSPFRQNGSPANGTNVVPMESVRPVVSDVTFADIGGISDVKVELEEIIDFLKNPKRYRNFGARMPRGVLLVGPPGVGKTMIAKAVAAEANVPFYYQSGASFVQIYVGMGAKRVHELFSAAKANAPSIIFIDEIDAVGKKRDGNRNDEREGTLNQLLTEMDGFEDTSGVIVVAATNKIDVLDEALLRAGRFDRRIFVDLPTPKEREAIVMKYLKHIPHDVQSEDIAKMTVGFNGASLAALVNEAALLSLRNNDLRVTMEHFHQVKDKVLFGKKRLLILTDEQKSYHARYQAGKALVAQWFDLPFEKVVLSSESIKPPIGEQMLKHEIESHIKVLLAGMAACDLRFSEHATNAATDVRHAKEMVSEMLESYAMGESLYPGSDERNCVLDRLYEETKALLSSKDDAIVAIEQILLERENISKEAIKEILNDVL